MSVKFAVVRSWGKVRLVPCKVIYSGFMGYEGRFQLSLVNFQRFHEVTFEPKVEYTFYL